MRTAITIPVTELLPHTSGMRLIDRVIEGDGESLVAEAEIGGNNLFFDGTGVGGWVGIEYMAQTVGAWAGWQARLHGRPPPIGFLLGTRHYEAQRAMFAVGQKLRIEVKRLYYAENGLGQFECRIDCDGASVATAALTVFEPPDPEAFLQAMADG